MEMTTKLLHCKADNCKQCPGRLTATQVISGPGGDDRASTTAPVEYICSCACRLSGINLHKPAIHVVHSKLERAGSIYRSNCPACKQGVLLMRRDNDTFELQAEDYCILCAQGFIYDDMEQIRAWSDLTFP